MRRGGFHAGKYRAFRFGNLTCECYEHGDGASYLHRTAERPLWLHSDSTVLEPVPYLNVVAGRELNPDNPNNSCLLLKKMGTDSGKVLYAGTMVKIDKRSLVSLWYINDAAIEKFAKCLVDAINMAKKWLDKTEGEFILDPDYYGIIW